VKTAQALDFHRNGVAKVRVEYVGPASLDGSDDKVLLATLRTDGQPAPAPSPVMVASAKPIFSASASSSSSGSVIRGPVPVPPDRPFDFGSGEHPLASASLRATGRPMAAAPVTAAAYTGPEPAAGGGAATSGFGLY
jgi:rare lipoprotein A